MKGLEAFENILNQELIKPDKYRKTIKDIASVGQVIEVEKELKQAEENEKLLNVFKNALTIEHHEYPTIEHDDNEDVISYLVKELYTIRQNELDKDMRKALREWVLKNAFPKELKVLEIIKNKNVALTMIKQTQSVEEYNMFAYDFLQIKRVDEEKYKLSPQSLAQEEYELIKEELLCQSEESH